MIDLLAHDYEMTTGKWVSMAAVGVMFLVFLAFIIYIAWEDQKFWKEYDRKQGR